MRNKQGLTPRPITDKNGKRTTVYVRPAGSNITRIPLPAPTYANPESEPYTKLYATFERIDIANSDKYIAGKLTRRIQQRATANDIAILNATLDAYPQFEDLLAAAALNDTNWNGIVSLAVVYDPSLPKGPSISNQRFMFLNSLDQAHRFIKGDVPDDGWALGAEDATIQAKAKRFVATFLIVRAGEGVPSYELIQRMLDSNRTDHDETLNILRSHPDATMNQIDFILSGGSKSLSGGAL
jgi:hypothetical protein